MMTNGDPEGWIFLSYPHTNNGFFFLLTTIFIYLCIYLFQNKLLKVPEYAKMQFNMMRLLDVLGKIVWVRYDFLSQGKNSDILFRCARNWYILLHLLKKVLFLISFSLF